MSISDEMKTAHGAASQLWDDYCETNTVGCPEGCIECCRGHFVPVWAPEVEILRRAIAALPLDFLKRRLHLARRHVRVHRRLRGKNEIPLKLSQVPLKQREDVAARLLPLLSEIGNEPCVLLGEKGCTVYADRPFLCRLYGYPTPSNRLNSCEIFEEHNTAQGKRLPMVPEADHDRVTSMPMKIADRMGDDAYNFTILPELFVEIAEERLASAQNKP